MKNIDDSFYLSQSDKKRLPVIDVCRMLLLTGVVAIHCNISRSAAEQCLCWAAWFVNFLSKDVFGGCVPVFFMLSGFLFFRNCDILSWHTYKRKVKSRIKTLLVPYLLWNFIGSLIFLCNAPSDWWMDIASVGRYMLGYVWGIGSGGEYPYDFVLWFVRNLIVFSFIAPIGWWMSRYTVVMAAWVVVDIISPVNTFGFLYYSLGCWGARHARLLKLPTWLSIASVATLIASAGGLSAILETDINTPGHSILLFIRNIAMCGTTLGIARLITPATGTRTLAMGGAVFFIYACHGLICGTVKRILIYAIGLGSPMKILTVYICAFAIMTSVSLALYLGLKWMSPRVASILTGFRD